MKKLFLMCGLPGAGKSTWLKNHIDTIEGVNVVVSRDAIRFVFVNPDEEYFSKEKEVFARFVEDGKNALSYADNVFMDATHISTYSRSKILRALGKSLKDVEINIIVIKSSMEECLEQNELREGTRSYVPRAAIRRMGGQFELPELSEGFNKIYIYNPNEKAARKYRVITKGEK